LDRTMNVSRADITDLQQIPNVGPAIAAKMRLIGISSAQDLPGKVPYEMYEDLCNITRVRHDHCLIDTRIVLLLL
jgi:hypothetical protein